MTAAGRSSPRSTCSLQHSSPPPLTPSAHPCTPPSQCSSQALCTVVLYLSTVFFLSASQPAHRLSRTHSSHRPEWTTTGGCTPLGQRSLSTFRQGRRFTKQHLSHLTPLPLTHLTRLTTTRVHTTDLTSTRSTTLQCVLWPTRMRGRGTAGVPVFNADTPSHLYRFLYSRTRRCTAAEEAATASATPE